MAALAGPPPGPPEEQGQQEGGSPSDHLASARDSLMTYLSAESDDIDKAKATQALKLIQDLHAKSQQEQEAAGGVTPVHRGMRRALSQ